MIDRGALIDFARDVAEVAQTQQLTLLAAGVAFYAFLSLVPIALLAFGIAVSLGGEAFADQLSDAVSDFLTPSAQQLLAEALVDETGRRSATVVGALGIVWGSSRVLRGLEGAFSQVYGTTAEKTVLDTFWNAAVVAGAVTAGLALVTAVEVGIAMAPVPGIGVIVPALVLPALVAAFLPMYVVFPGPEVGIREALPGTLLAAVGWLVLSRSFAVYATVAAGSAVYGALGGVLLVLVWLYVGAIVVVFGAVVNAVLAGREQDRQLQSPGSRQFGQRAMSDDDTAGDGETPAGVGDAASRSAADREPTDRRRSDRTRDRADDPAALREEIERLRDELAALEDGVEGRTVRRDALESDLKRYVRRRVRRGKAHGWGPYLVLLYGTAMTIGAFYFLSGGWAVLAMLVVWTSTLGIYLLMVLFGTVISMLGLPGRLRDRIGDWRS